MEKIVPSIDLQDFPAQYELLRRACQDWGCFRLLNHNIPNSLMSEMKNVVSSLLHLPIEIKRRNSDVIAGSGYVAPSPANPLYEALGLYDIGSSEAVHNFCNQLDASPHQREVVEAYARAVNEVAMDLAGKLGESMGIDRGRDVFEGWPSQFRINKYNFSPESVGSSGVQTHTDSGFLTILQEDEHIGGLEVMDKTGQFVAVNPQPGTLLVNLGDVAKAWSNGRLCNVKHRVQCKEAGIRVSIATFLLAPKEAPVEAPPELVDSQHPRLFTSFSYEDYRELRLKTKLSAGEALELVRINSSSSEEEEFNKTSPV